MIRVRVQPTSTMTRLGAKHKFDLCLGLSKYRSTDLRSDLTLIGPNPKQCNLDFYFNYSQFGKIIITFDIDLRLSWSWIHWKENLVIYNSKTYLPSHSLFLLINISLKLELLYNSKVLISYSVNPRHLLILNANQAFERDLSSLQFSFILLF